MTIPKRVLGKTGLEVSALGFGCMRLPLASDKHDDIDVPLTVSMIRKAVDAGVNYFDTAYVYHSNSFTSPGQSEPVLRQALTGGYRDKALVASKLPLWLVRTRADMDRLLDEQIQRLGGPLDIYLAHNITAGVWGHMKELGLFSFFDSALKDGRIRQAGFSFHDRFSLFEDVLTSYDWGMAQIQYNYLDVDHQAGRRGLRLAHERGVGVVVMEPLRGGFLVNQLPQTGREILKKARPDWSFAEWALRWVLDQPEVSVVLSGVSTMEQLDENLRLADHIGSGNLTEEDHEAIRQVRQLFLDRTQVGCTACGYCLPCPFGVAIPKIFSLYNEYHFTDDPKAQATARMFYDGMAGEDKPASDCTSCGTCVERCPQHIDIPAEMGKAARLFHAE